MEKYETEIRSAPEWKATGVCVGSSIKEYIRFLSEVKDSSLKGKSTGLNLGDLSVRNVWTVLGKALDCVEKGDWSVTEKSVSWVWRPAFSGCDLRKKPCEKKFSKSRLAFQFLNFCVNLMYSSAVQMLFSLLPRFKSKQILLSSV